MSWRTRFLNYEECPRGVEGGREAHERQDLVHLHLVPFHADDVDRFCCMFASEAINLPEELIYQ